MKYCAKKLAAALRKLEGAEFTANFIFLDPPTAMENLYLQTLQQLSQSRLVRSGKP